MQTEGDEPDEGVDDESIEAGGQRLVRLNRRRPAPPSNDTPKTAAPSRPRRRRPTPSPPSPPENVVETAPAAAPMTNHVAPPPTPAPAIASLIASGPTDSNILIAFEETLKLFPAAAQTIAVERKSGTPATWMLTERPRTANELYAAIRRLHGRNPETTYEVTFRDGAGHGGGGPISIPSTVDEPLPQGQPAIAPHYPHAAPAQSPTVQVTAPSTDPIAMMQAMFQMFQQMQPQQPPAPQPQPAQVPTPFVMPATPPTDPMAMMQAMFQMFQQMQPKPNPPQTTPAPGAPSTPAPQVTPGPPTDPMAMMQRMFGLFQEMQAKAQGSQPPAHAPLPHPPPTVVVPPAVDPMAMMQQMFGLFQQMHETVRRSQPAPSAGPYRPRYPGDERDPSAPPYGRSPYAPPPQRPRTAAEELRDAVSVMRSTIEVAQEFGGFGAPAAEPPPPPDDDDNPVKVIDMGPAKGVINRSDGSLRGFETVMANLPDIIKFVGETGTAIRKAREANVQRSERQRPNLPPGYVYAGPDYQPPEGFVAVPVDEIPQQAASESLPPNTHGGARVGVDRAAQAPLPEPPAEMPPPIAESGPSQTWGMPRPGGG